MAGITKKVYFCAVIFDDTFIGKCAAMVVEW